MISTDNDLRIFGEFAGVTAGFTRKPDNCDARRDGMIAAMKEVGGCVVKPILVHGKEVAVVDEKMVAGKSYIEIPDTDGVVTNVPNVVLTTTHADCIPLYAYDSEKHVVGIAHAGWKGTSNGIAQELISKMVETYGCNPANIIAYIGPGICKKHFEFGKDYARECFTSNFNWMKEFISKKLDAENKDKLDNEIERSNIANKTDITKDKVTIDLKGINEHFFELAKVGEVQASDDCTYCDDRYYSYRRAKDTERMLAYIKLK